MSEEINVLDYVENFRNSLANQSQTDTANYAELSRQTTQIGKDIESLRGAIALCNEFITEISAEDDQHVVRRNELTQQRTNLVTTYRQNEKQLTDLHSVLLSTSGALEALHHVSSRFTTQVDTEVNTEVDTIVDVEEMPAVPDDIEEK